MRADARERPGTAPSRRHSPLRVACVGHAALDHVYEVESFPTQPIKTLARGYRARAGGMSLHASIAAARLGAQVRLLGRVGDDSAAAFLRERLAAEGVDALGLESVQGTSTSVAAVIVDGQGQRQIFVHRGSALERAHRLDTRQLDGADVVLVDPRWPEGAAAALAWARAHGVPSMFDADVAPLPVLDELLPLARWVVFSEPGLALWARGAPTDEALAAAGRSGPTLVLVTQGERGARFVDHGGAPRHVAALRVRALDTTGAGDVFHAALALALAEGRTTADAVAWASAAAACKCERRGGVEGAPTRRELQAWLRRRDHAGRQQDRTVSAT